jgi:hypothetical protein
MVIRPTVKELARRGFALFVAGLLGLLEGERRLRRLVFTPGKQDTYCVASSRRLYAPRHIRPFTTARMSVRRLPPPAAE